MSHVRAFLAFLYDFIVGDDPVVAALVVAAIAAAAAIPALNAAAWWLLPVAVLAALSWSVLRAAR